ncbi:unnamed protein product [Mytilus coruscus]|uniref:Integrase zinc-binding domain-containing protein n=1 Tax=Mytilus coruscus TaxID=42192 RepID=A0A6J8EZY7_MYTCO|nr:unnamed protein product [Mytilus coruscus]
MAKFLKKDRKLENYQIDNGILYHFFNARSRSLPKGQNMVKQLAIPRTLRKEVLEAFHDNIVGCHQGEERTYEAVRQRYYWPNMYTDIKTYIKTCEICQRSKRDTRSHSVPLKPMPIEKVFSKWHMDILELPETPEKYRYLLLVVDSGSKWLKKGQSPKLTVRWTGPFTITNLGPPDCNTFKLRRDSDNKISKKLVNASRLKVFKSKTDRPDYLLDDTDDPFEEDEDENQQVQNEGAENQT